MCSSPLRRVDSRGGVRWGELQKGTRPRSKGLINYLMREPATAPPFEHNSDEPSWSAAPDLRLPRVSSPPGRLVLQRGGAVANREPCSRCSTSPAAERKLVQPGPSGKVRVSSRGTPEQHKGPVVRGPWRESPKPPGVTPPTQAMLAEGVAPRGGACRYLLPVGPCFSSMYATLQRALA